MHTDIIIYPVILCGGHGTRLWPLSTAERPKPFLALSHPEYSLFQETILRIQDKALAIPVIVCQKEHKDHIQEQLTAINISQYTLLIEPCMRGTAPAIALAALHIEEQYGADACMLVLPSDHIIEQPQTFLESIKTTIKLAKIGQIITFGITPHTPDTNFGYIEKGHAVTQNAFKVQQFIEKPPLEEAKKYCTSDTHYWNAGIFMLTPCTYLAELEHYEPTMYTQCIQTYATLNTHDQTVNVDAHIFSQIQKNSIDYAIIERTKKAIMTPLACGWHDIGTWKSLWSTRKKDQHNNVNVGRNHVINTHNSYIHCEKGPKVVVNGLEDVIVISTPDHVFISHKNTASKIKPYIKKILDSDS